LKEIVRELAATIKANLSIDWTDYENVKARTRVAVKRLLKHKGLRPEEVNILVLPIMEQAESLYEDWPQAVCLS
jgi:type I restriction enzyme R subunit